MSSTARVGFALAIGVVGLGACGGGGKAAPTTTTVPVATTAPAPQVNVDPAEGPIGTVFTFRVAQLHTGATVIFKVSGPNNHSFVGNPHPVGADGTVTAQYRATAGNPLGLYTVHATDNGNADLATGTFTVGSAAVTASTSTTIHVLTTPTTKAPVTTRTTVRASTTTKLTLATTSTTHK